VVKSLTPKYEGPYMIIFKWDARFYALGSIDPDQVGNYKLETFSHISDLKAYHVRSRPDLNNQPLPAGAVPIEQATLPSVEELTTAAEQQELASPKFLTGLSDQTKKEILAAQPDAAKRYNLRPRTGHGKSRHIKGKPHKAFPDDTPAPEFYEGPETRSRTKTPVAPTGEQIHELKDLSVAARWQHLKKAILEQTRLKRSRFPPKVPEIKPIEKLSIMAAKEIKNILISYFSEKEKIKQD
jgi:hypothetical protein